MTKNILPKSLIQNGRMIGMNGLGMDFFDVPGKNGAFRKKRELK